MKKIFLSLVLLAAPNAFSSTYSCEVAGAADYRVEINTNTKSAAFFDNDDWTILRLTEHQVLSAKLIFDGKDLDNENVRVVLDLSEFQGASSVSYKANRRTVNTPINCHYTPASDLNSGI
ncbi:hypothetical protein D3C87_1048690 [compost metagenome]